MRVADSDLCALIKKTTGRDAFKCSICGEFFYGWGNNPYPVTTGENDRCCDICNETKVIPARLAQMLGGGK